MLWIRHQIKYESRILSIERKQVFSKSKLSKAYSNRSAASFHLKEYELCLKDIQRAETLISESSSSNLTQYDSISFKLCKRKTIALSFLFKLNNVNNMVLVEDVKKCWADLMNMSGNTDKPDLEKQFKQFFPEWSIPPSSESTDSRSSVNVHSDDESHCLNSSATSARISYTESAGRFLVARCDVDIGENIVMDSPFAIVPCLEHQNLNPREVEAEGTSKSDDTSRYINLQCSECARLLDPIPVICPSPQCTFHFCSLYCLRSSRFHAFECGKNWLQTLEPLSWLSFRVFCLVWFDGRQDKSIENCVNRLGEELVNVDLYVDTDSGTNDSDDSDFDPFVERPAPRKSKNRGVKIQGRRARYNIIHGFRKRTWL
ncbi:hypothetical protein BKA69DRAFT_602519 [Paraphysoderma sedebokerense]|nr:hypothetical protein BKA69DRAFT_602519 [Paraphysoderma sedebokerense]